MKKLSHKAKQINSDLLHRVLSESCKESESVVETYKVLKRMRIHE